MSTNVSSFSTLCIGDELICSVNLMNCDCSGVDCQIRICYSGSI